MRVNRSNLEEMSAAYRAALRTEMVSTVNGTRPARAPRKAKVAGAGVVVFAVLGSGAAFAYSQISNAPVTDRSQARCYSTAKYVSGADFPGTTVAAVDNGSTAGRVDSATEACAAVWRAGILRQGVDGVVRGDPSRAVYPVPQLFGCVMPNGQAAVFPGDGTCAAVGLPAVTPGS